MSLTSTPIKPSFPGKSLGEYQNKYAFAALRADGSVVTWGDILRGGDTGEMASHLDGTIDVVEIFSTFDAFAALRADGSVVTWGNITLYNPVARQLNGAIDVVEIFSTLQTFAALRADGSVVTWGRGGAIENNGFNSVAVANQLNGTIDVVEICSTEGAFAALRADGSVVNWGREAINEGTLMSELDGTIDAVGIFSTSGAFAALRADGSVVTWPTWGHIGSGFYGGDSFTVASQLNGTIDVVEIFSTYGAFAALRADGSVVTWGGTAYGDYGANSSAVASQLDGTIDVVEIFSTFDAFAALRADGSVVSWGDINYGGDSSAVASQLSGSNDVVEIFSTYGAFAALRADGSVVTWGNSGGDSSAVASQLNGTIDVVEIFSTVLAFAALRADGSVVTWGGRAGQSGDSSAVASQLDGTIDVVEIFSTGDAFAALRADGSVVTWRWGSGGDSGAVASQLDGTIDVVSMANPFADDEYTADTTPPTATSFTPIDEALDVAIGANVVVTFSEAIQRGTGNVLLKTAGGTVVATYDAATSTNLTVSGSTLTLDPSADLAHGTAYQIEFAAGTIKDLAGNPYTGTASYNFTTTSGINTITGTAGNDLLPGTSATDMISGLGGIDTVQFSGASSSHSLTKTAPAAWTVIGEGSDQLVDVERLQFSDTKIALDLAPTEHGGQALEFIGVLAPSLVHAPQIVGVILGLIDGGTSLQGVFQLAIDIGLVNDIAGSSSDAALAQMAFRNVIGAEADAGMTDLLVSFMDGRNAHFSHADFLTVIAGMEINQVHIDLIGLQQTGIEFI
jgi:alpha-tubulin suppressor-like RCC1 family protein